MSSHSKAEKRGAKSEGNNSDTLHSSFLLARAGFIAGLWMDNRMIRMRYDTWENARSHEALLAGLPWIGSDIACLAGSKTKVLISRPLPFFHPRTEMSNAIHIVLWSLLHVEGLGISEQKSRKRMSSDEQLGELISLSMRDEASSLQDGKSRDFQCVKL